MRVAPHVQGLSPARVGAATAMATMGALPLGQAPEGVEDENGEPINPYAYAAASVGGATIGGALIGYLAGGDLRGAGTGAMLTAGLASAANAVPMVRRLDRRVIGIGFGLGGLALVGGSIWLAATRRS